MSVQTEGQNNIKRSVAVPAIFLIGCTFLLSAYMTGDAGQYFWGGIICLGSVVLYLVRQKDWKKHFEELEIERNRRLGSDKNGDRKDNE